ncbi:hypothetical protein ABZ468_55460, partial [Streptomyces sp. NPDC005708]|uniref:hypothetical protein n=1 Tax=Streptomyces sp. NPDC005708 TaxID=3154564 RepID=UPI0033F6DB25
RYSETGTPGSASGLENRAGGNTGTALQVDSTGRRSVGRGERLDALTAATTDINSLTTRRHRTRRSPARTHT